jgi:phosphohistidine swiveling domain-containing protein
VKLQPHPAANLFPMLAQSELETMAADIKANGQSVPIAVLNGAFIIDGRNRYAACKIAGVEPKTREMQSEFSSEADVIRYIISTNIHRRHLTTSQRAMIAAELANLMPGSNQHIHKLKDGSEVRVDSGELVQKCTPSQAADMMNVGRRTVYQAKEVADQAPDLAAKVKAGEIKVSKAASMAKERSRPTKPTKPTKPPVKPDPDRADDSVPKAVFACLECGETFDVPLWHCKKCDHHWPMHVQECRNCHEETAPKEPDTEQVDSDDAEQGQCNIDAICAMYVRLSPAGKVAFNMWHRSHKDDR